LKADAAREGFSQTAFGGNAKRGDCVQPLGLQILGRVATKRKLEEGEALLILSNKKKKGKEGI